MDGLGPALFGLFLVTFTVSKPVSLYLQLTFSSSESSESNESSSSSEEITVPRTTIVPIVLNTMRPGILEDNRHQANDHTAHPGLARTTPHPANTGQKVVELGLDTSLGPLPPSVPDHVSPDVTTPELRCYTVELTSPEPKPARGDNV
ncbi:uncharacterized protein LOC143749211 [Siphateles boraxobius]|uniref:uncharacterized protein LOC143749211 n=1 Tax=Siphateles boraxobius TaxID=180520 RepID=UPI0040647410